MLPSASDVLGAAGATAALSVAAFLALLAVVLGILATRATRVASRANDGLRRSEERFRVLAESSPVGVFLTDPDGRRLYLNPAMLSITGEQDRAGAVDRPLLIADEDRPGVLATWGAAARGRRSFDTRFRLRRPDGELRWVRVDASPLLGGGEITGWVGSVRDVTDETALHERLERLTQTIEMTPDVVAMTEVDGRLRYLNAAGRRILGIDADADVTRLRLVDFYPAATQETFAGEAMPAAERDGVWRGEMMLRDADGLDRPTSHVLVAHRRPDGSMHYLSVIARDITEQKAFEAQLVHAGLHDSLTNLPNRVLFMDRLSQALARARRRDDAMVAVLICDIDRFKLVNDSYGHDAGDELLVRVAARIHEALLPGESAARFGGDTFSVLCEDVPDEDEAVNLAHRLRRALATPFEVDGDRVFLTVSVGIALSAHGPVSAETLLRDSDAAMHRAKEKGGARHEVFTEHVRYSAVQRLRTANDLHRALTDQEFRLVYQPEVDLHSGHINGVEALVRWHHPERGLVVPGEFIRLAEETGQIEAIGIWVLDESVRQAALWRQARHDGGALPVWVNLSARQLASPSLVDYVAGALARHQVEAAQIGLEITESALFEDAEAAVAILGALRELGVRLAIDDFGTGYSSLAYLKRLPVDAVKIDRSFVDGLGNDTGDSDDSAIVAAVSAMAAALRLDTIAEGVESRAQVDALRDIGCDLAQGYYFTTPQPPSNISRLLEGDRMGALFVFDGVTSAAGPGPLRNADEASDS